MMCEGLEAIKSVVYFIMQEGSIPWKLNEIIERWLLFKTNDADIFNKLMMDTRITQNKESITRT